VLPTHTYVVTMVAVEPPKRTIGHVWDIDSPALDPATPDGPGHVEPRRVS
jgi:hypothetical protein